MYTDHTTLKMIWTTHKTWISWIVLAIVKQRIAWQLKVGMKVEDKSAHFRVSWPIKFSVASRLWPKKAKWMTRNPEGIVCPIPLQWGQSFEFRGEGAGFSVMGAISSTTWRQKNEKASYPLETWKCRYAPPPPNPSASNNIMTACNVTSRFDQLKIQKNDYCSF